LGNNTAIVPQHVISRIPLPTANIARDKTTGPIAGCDLHVDIDDTLLIAAGGDCRKVLDLGMPKGATGQLGIITGSGVVFQSMKQHK
jgi:hypothetical protein